MARLLRWVVLSGMTAGRKLITQVSNEKDETSDSSIPDVDPYVCTLFTRTTIRMERMHTGEVTIGLHLRSLCH